MQLITPNWMAATAAQAFKRNYQFDDGAWATFWISPGKPIYEKLLSLGSNPSPESGQSILGLGWVEVRCCECGRYVQSAVGFGGDGGSPGTFQSIVCTECIEKAQELSCGD